MHFKRTYRGARHGSVTAFTLLRDTFYAWLEDKAPRLGAALAYYSVFSLAPLLIITIAIAGMVFGEEAARGQVVYVIDDMIGKQGAEVIQEMLINTRKKDAGLVATAVGVTTLFIAASGLFGELKDALNTVWGVKPRPEAGILGTLKERFWSITMVLGVGFLLLVSLALTAILTTISTYFTGSLPGGEVLWQWVNTIITFFVITGLFALMYKYLPDAEVAWQDVWIGAAMTSALFALGKYALGLYIGLGTIGSPYGAAGSLVVLLIWVYYTAQILFFGAEFTKVYASRYGRHIAPSEGAMLMSEASRISQGIPTEPGSVAERIAPDRPEGQPSEFPGAEEEIPPAPPGKLS